MAYYIDLPLHILFYREGDYFIGHCLDFDLVTQIKIEKENDKYLSTARYRTEEMMKDCIKTYIKFSYENDNHMRTSLYKPAPKKYWDIYWNTIIEREFNNLDDPVNWNETFIETNRLGMWITEIPEKD